MVACRHTTSHWSCLLPSEGSNQSKPQLDSDFSIIFKAGIQNPTRRIQPPPLPWPDKSGWGQYKLLTYSVCHYTCMLVYNTYMALKNSSDHTFVFNFPSWFRMTRVKVRGSQLRIGSHICAFVVKDSLLHSLKEQPTPTGDVNLV